MNNCVALGLDVGSNSIGWALVDESKKTIVAAGVRIFPEGVNRDTKQAEVSKNETRRTARMARRQAARRANRTRRLRKMLVQIGLLPEVALRDPNNADRVAWERDAFKEADPYTLRRRALTEKLTPHEIGRVLIHLSQRRGFLSNRKADRRRKDETQGILGEISRLETELNGRTLGEFLAQEQELDSQARLRRRHTRREMYAKEFDAIWAVQQKHHPDLLTEHLKHGSEGRQMYPCKPRTVGKKSALDLYGIHGSLFFQRSLYSPKSVIGTCELEPKLKRCPRADRVAQRFRLVQEVNNLRLLDGTTARERPLTSDERSKLIDYLADSSERKFDEIRKHLKLPHARFNLERGGRKKLHGLATDKQLKKVLGKLWMAADEQKKNRLVRMLLDAEEPEIRDHCLRDWASDSAVADKLLSVHLMDGYASYSVAAIQKLLPILEQGMPLRAPAGQPCALQAAGYVQIHEIVPNQQAYLPMPPDVTNPIVRQGLFEVRKVVNAILREYGKPARIHIELAREIKGTARQRAETALRMRERERARDAAAGEIRSWGTKATRDAIDRYLLWKEQQKKCVYSGRPISQRQLLEGEVDLDHVLPFSRTLDDSLMNRVLAFREENDRKGDRTPFEWLAKQDAAKYEEVLNRADKLPYAKARKFREQTIELEDFLSRQLVDSQYIARQIHGYVQCLGADVVCTKGNHTATLRQHWGLNTVLRHDEMDLKNRDDHRHHAVDAVIIAFTDRSRLQALARLRKTGVDGEVMPEPWDRFRDHVETAVNKINVSHRVSRKVRGPLHDETLYGPTQFGERRDKAARPWAKDWTEEIDQFVIRKSLDELSLSEVPKIRDARVREIVEERLRQFNLVGGKKKRGGAENSRAKGGSISAEVWKEPLYLTPRGANGGQPAQIKKVRILSTQTTLCPIRNATTFVKPGKNHHVCLFEFVNASGKNVREAFVVSMLEAYRRQKDGQNVIQRAHPARHDARFLYSLSAGEMVQVTRNGKCELFRVAEIWNDKRIVFRNHTVAVRSDDNAGLFRITATKLTDCQKVAVDRLGHLRWAND
jgi:CRISPR-associated endonuclease Csn1